MSLYLRILFDFLSKDNWDLKDYFCLCVILNNGVERLFIKVMAFNSILTPFNFLTPEVGWTIHNPLLTSPLLRSGIWNANSASLQDKKLSSKLFSLLPLRQSSGQEKGELEGDENPLNPKILRKERHVKHTSTLLSEASLLHSYTP